MMFLFFALKDYEKSGILYLSAFETNRKLRNDLYKINGFFQKKKQKTRNSDNETLKS